MAERINPMPSKAPKAAGAPSVLTRPTIYPLRCAVCLHTPPGDRDITQADRAITVMAGHALCEEHIDLFTLPSDVEEWLLDERMKK